MKNRQWIIWNLNRLAMLANRLRMGANITLSAVPQRLGRYARFVRVNASPSRAVTAVALVAAIATPTVLYLTQRQENETLQRKYMQLTFESASEAAFWRASASELLEERTYLTGLLLDEGQAIEQAGRITVKVVATGYSSSIWETDMTPFITAANTPTRKGIVAMSRDLLSEYTNGAPFSYGDLVHVPGLGDFIVEDTMNARWTNRIDVWFPSRLEALRFGVRQAYISRAIDEENGREGALTENAAVSATSGGGS